MTAPQIKIGRTGERDGYLVAVTPAGDAYHTGTLVVVGQIRRISADEEPEAWKAWLFPAAGGWAHITQSCEAIESQSTEQLLKQLQKRAGKGAWWQ